MERYTLVDVDSPQMQSHPFETVPLVSATRRSKAICMCVCVCVCVCVCCLCVCVCVHLTLRALYCLSVDGSLRVFSGGKVCPEAVVQPWCQCTYTPWTVPSSGADEEVVYSARNKSAWKGNMFITWILLRITRYLQRSVKRSVCGTHLAHRRRRGT